MDDTKGIRGLMAAVIFQAADDHLKDEYRKETTAFFKSDGFSWLWETLTTDLSGMPRVQMARERVLAGQVMTRRKAYHARWANN